MTNFIKILLDMPNFVAISKPCGISMHNNENESGFVSLVRSQLDDSALLPVHRLDRETSGVILLAKGSESAAKLSQLFQLREIHKYYWAISNKKGKKKQGTIIGDMEKSRNGNWKLTRGRENPATTQFFSYGLGEGLRAFILKPVTGKTHQLRVALKSLGSPILGDSRYKGDPSDRMYLHAYSLSFQLEQDHYNITAPFDTGEHFLSTGFSEKVVEIGSPDTLKWPV